MKWILFICLVANSFITRAQSPIDSVQFFKDEALVEMTLTTDIKKLQDKKSVEAYQPAQVSVKLPDGTTITEQIRMYARGKSRRENCLIPPIMLNFHNATSPKLYPLSRLKLVVGCGSSEIDEQLVLKEFLIYKIYNLLDEKSFRVRLVRATYTDSKGKMKPITQYSYLIEDVDDMAARNGCEASKKQSFQIEETDQAKMNQVEIFEYMIANIDWSVPGNHNIKVIFPKDDNAAKGLTVPYDFDNAGLVNAYYATPNELLGATSVTERIYRGFPRKIEVIQNTLAVFEKQKENILSLIKNFELLKPKAKSEMTSYIEDFYKIIGDKTQVQNVFILNARKE
ncbi:MAG: hypothetical protein IPQ06_08050 [Chitinophagaceae bacterium]|nr:hypothetical protein [Chitinophagaceae bacterium]